MMEWQPIETAPKDGTLILLAGGEAEDLYDYDEREFKENGWPLSRPVVAFWLDYGDGCWAHAWWDGAWRSIYINPTHWMPLPEPPPDYQAFPCGCLYTVRDGTLTVDCKQPGGSECTIKKELGITSVADIMTATPE